MRCLSKRTKIAFLLLTALLIAPAFHIVAADINVLKANGKIAFISTRDGNEQIYVMNADGSGQTRLANNNYDDEYPCWSPDGAKIAFVSDRDGNREIYVMNADGSGQTRLTNNSAWDYGPKWSPDGSKIAFSSDRDGNWEVYVMNTDGSGQTRLTNNNAGDEQPRWSPDGTKIAFRNSYNGALLVIDADGRNLTTIGGNIWLVGWTGIP